MVKHNTTLFRNDIGAARVVNEDDKRGCIQVLITKLKGDADTFEVGVPILRSG